MTHIGNDAILEGSWRLKGTLFAPRHRHMPKVTRLGRLDCPAARSRQVSFGCRPFAPVGLGNQSQLEICASWFRRLKANERCCLLRPFIQSSVRNVPPAENRGRNHTQSREVMTNRFLRVMETPGSPKRLLSILVGADHQKHEHHQILGPPRSPAFPRPQ